ncbi:high light inducible protein [Prochlorococcus marinus XMU1402]|uniref:high light inducible protein n=1 Tax=Prochlorococcus marinus TaxID=1219 RepID=UPI001B210B57|nr:high light inducible protein [Prochlorococcus marinus XMU1402]
MEKKEDNIRSESYYPDSNFYIDNKENDISDKANTSQKNSLLRDQILNMGENFEWPNTYWFIAERTNGRLAMIGFMAVIINYTLFGWIAYPIL